MLPILQDAIERQKRLLTQSLARTEERIQQLATQLRVDSDGLAAGDTPLTQRRNSRNKRKRRNQRSRRHRRARLDSRGHKVLQ